MIGGYPCNYNVVGLTANEKGTIHLTTCEAWTYFVEGGLATTPLHTCGIFTTYSKQRVRK